MKRFPNRTRFRPRRALLLITVLLIILFVVILFRPRTPHFSGKPITYWLAESGHANSNRAAQAQRVLRDNTSQTIQFLLDKARAEGSTLHNHNLRWRLWVMFPASFRNHLPRPREKDDCLSAISTALHRLGPIARPELLKALEDPNENVRYVAGASFPYLQDDWDTAVAWQTNLLRLAEYDLRQYAAAMLSLMGTNAYAAIPALLHTMQHDKIDYIRQTAATSLARLAPGISHELAPKFRESMQDTYPSIRIWSAITLWKIERDPQALSFLISEFNKGINSEEVSVSTVLTIFGEAGPLAEPAIPAIQDIIDSPARFTEAAAFMSNAAVETLSKIKPPKK